MTDLGHIERASSEIERLELGETSGDVARERVEGGRLSKADGESNFLDLHAGIDRSSEGDLEIDKLALFVPGIHLDSSEGLEAGDQIPLPTQSCSPLYDIVRREGKLWRRDGKRLGGMGSSST